MRLGAVLAIGAKSQTTINGRFGLNCFSTTDSSDTGHYGFLKEPAECVDVLGRSPLERMVERFVKIEVQDISVLIEEGAIAQLPSFGAEGRKVRVQVVNDLSTAISRELGDYAREGIDRSFISCAGAYTETDLLDLFCFHREARRALTGTFDSEGPLPLWIADCAKVQESHFESSLVDTEKRGASNYFIREYVNRLQGPRDLRRMAADILRGACQTKPSGEQVRPNVWIDDGAEIHSRARIVGPSYIGRETSIRADALITRSSAIEKDSCIDCGTVIEDSSVLPRTNIGICLDLCHAVASENTLFSLQRDLAIEISDPNLMRSTVAARKSVSSASERNQILANALALQESQQTLGAWQFDNNLIQE